MMTKDDESTDRTEPTDFLIIVLLSVEMVMVVVVVVVVVVVIVASRPSAATIGFDALLFDRLDFSFVNNSG
jgi:hypothetical protein